MRITKKVGNRVLIINIPSLDGGEPLIVITFLLTDEENNIRVTEDGMFERILE